MFYNVYNNKVIEVVDSLDEEASIVGINTKTGAANQKWIILYLDEKEVA